MTNGNKLKPFEDYIISKYCLKVPFGKFAWIVVSVPFFSFVFCAVYSILYNFEKSTSSHCHVYNFLPSVSSIIGNFYPQKNIWQFAVIFQFIPRLLVANFYLKYHQEVLYPWTFCCNILVCFLNVIENIALIILSFWTSSNSYAVHKFAFITFICVTECYMLIIWIMHKRFRRSQRNTAEVKSLKLKKRILLLNLICIILAVYFFMRHNSFCEPYVYSAFAFFEYVIVLSNMAFHMTAYLDFSDRMLLLSFNGIEMKYR
ncbi:post-GPI attachment to proteins factor 2 [Agrilus planipennis]|uniref:Post-GPI attachment to proteins factor 2 n=1 Tax=Agrilus planipennis TaxID=224129 RepID=A0A1W4WTX0_AGRPL|nr:post-GPI attachment to proteins factor 2 [Agrilus planipennis]